MNEQIIGCSEWRYLYWLSHASQTNNLPITLTYEWNERIAMNGMVLNSARWPSALSNRRINSYECYMHARFVSKNKTVSITGHHPYCPYSHYFFSRWISLPIKNIVQTILMRQRLADALTHDYIRFIFTLFRNNDSCNSKVHLQNNNDDDSGEKLNRKPKNQLR